MYNVKFKLMYKKAVYISEINLPSSSAYSIHVMKMCSALSGENFDTKLFTISNLNDQVKNLKNYNCKNKFQINSVYSYKKNLNFIERLIFSFKVHKQLDNKIDLIISRSIVASIVFAFLKRKNILELHHEPQGISGILFNLAKFLKIYKYIKIILLHPNILNKFDIKKFNYLIEDDAVDPIDFKQLSKKDEYPSNYFLYVGSFFRGKGIEIISKIAKENPNLVFHLYGSIKTLKIHKEFLPKNIIFFKEVNYEKIPNIITKYKTVLMPYLNKVNVRSKSLDVGLNMSPLKMFDYLASGKLIVASDLDVYKHVLQNNYNSILIGANELQKWGEVLNLIADKEINFEMYKNNAQKTSKLFTWEDRVKRIKEFNNQAFFDTKFQTSV